MSKHVSSKSAQQAAFNDMIAAGINAHIIRREKDIRALPKNITVVFNP